MIYLAKILPVIFLPVGAAIVLLVASLVFRKRWLGGAALLVLWLSSTPLIADFAMRSAEGWQVPVPVASVPESRAIVVLAGTIRRVPSSVEWYEWGDGVDRFDAGVALLEADKAPILVFTGGWLPWRPDDRLEGEVLAERAEARGIPRSRIVVTGQAANTAAEADGVRRVLERTAGAPARPSVTLVTSAFHMRRARLIFEQAGFRVIPFPVDFRTSEGPFTILDLLPSSGGLGHTEIALRELYGYLFYRLRH